MEPAAKKQKLEDTVDVASSGDINTSDEVAFLKEKDVGICEYINSLPGFHAVLKQRYSDFIVNEIDKSGNVVHLTSKEYVPEEKPKEEEPIEETESGEPHALTDTQRQVIDDGILTENDIEKLRGLVASKDKKASIVLHKEDINDKVQRTKIHSSIRKCFSGLESSTTEYQGEKVIKVEKMSGGGGRSRNRYFNPWPADREDFCKFVLYKTAKDTMNAMWLIAKQLKVNHSLFSFAGTKDKRAKTTQEVTAYRITAEKLAGVNKFLMGIVLGNFRYVSSRMQLGDLKGNKFTIVLKNVMAEDDLLNKSMTSLKDVGFINYYGMQRFGTSTIPTHHIGRALLQNNYKEAVELILKPRAGEDDITTSSRKIWTDTRDAKQVLRKLPKRCTVERALLEGLLKEGENYSNALTRIPRGTRLMYFHSYQSYIWNSIVSRRIKKYGLKPVVGDFVLSEAIDTENLEGRDEVEDGDDNPSKADVPLIILDEETVTKYTIHDVVLPLPGFSVKYPENEVGSWYTTMLKEDNLTPECFRHKNKSYVLPGAFRKIVIKPQDVSWQTYMYNDVNCSLALSDLDIMENEPEPQSEKDGKFKALKIEMSLPSSCYATMAIREILKCETSSAYQKKGNDPSQTGSDVTQADTDMTQSEKT